MKNGTISKSLCNNIEKCLISNLFDVTTNVLLGLKDDFNPDVVHGDTTSASSLAAFYKSR